jgi:hypothetical protein
MVGRYVRTRLHCQHRECLADILFGPPNFRDAEDRLILFREKPLVLAFFLLSAGSVNP